MDEKCSRCSDRVYLWNETEENGVINHTLIGEYCRLNECKYADMEYDLRELHKKIAKIIQRYDRDDLSRSSGFERIKELIEGVTSTHSSTDYMEKIEDIRNKIMLTMDECEPACKSQNNFRGGLFIALNIIDKYISGKENHETCN